MSILKQVCNTRGDIPIIHKNLFLDSTESRNQKAKVQYKSDEGSNFVTWENGETSILRSVWYSVSNSLTASYGQVAPSSDLGNSVSMIQLLIMFAFLTIIIGGSVPQTRQDRED